MSFLSSLGLVRAPYLADSSQAMQQPAAATDPAQRTAYMPPGSLLGGFWV